MATPQADESLSVMSVLGGAWDSVSDALSPIIGWLSGIGWDIGDWTFFTPIALPVLLWIGLRIMGRSTYNRPYFKLALAGLIIGGVIEHFQPAAEQWLAGFGTI